LFLGSFFSHCHRDLSTVDRFELASAPGTIVVTDGKFTATGITPLDLTLLRLLDDFSRRVAFLATVKTPVHFQTFCFDGMNRIIMSRLSSNSAAAQPAMILPQTRAAAKAG
jgi:hypothetical protein